MGKVSVQVEVPEQFHQLLLAAMDIVLGLYVPLSDGVDISDLDDIAKIVPEALKVLKNFSGAISDVEGDKVGAALSAAIAVDYLIDELKKLQQG